MSIILESLTSEWEGFLRLAPRFFLALLIFVIIVILGRIAGRGISLVLARGNFPETHREFFRKLTIWLFVFFGISISLGVIGLKGVAAGMLTGGGVTAIVLGFAFREVGENFLAGFFLAFSRPFRVGDLIQSGDLQGVVKGIELRSTHIRAGDGRDIFIPSSQLFKMPLINYTLDGLRRLEFRVGIDYRDDAGRACREILEVLKGEKNILEEPPPYAGLLELGANYVELTVSFWVDAIATPNIAQTRSSILNRCREALIASGYTVSSEVSTNIHIEPDGVPGARPEGIRESSMQAKP